MSWPDGGPWVVVTTSADVSWGLAAAVLAAASPTSVAAVRPVDGARGDGPGDDTAPRDPLAMYVDVLAAGADDIVDTARALSRTPRIGSGGWRPVGRRRGLRAAGAGRRRHRAGPGRRRARGRRPDRARAGRGRRRGRRRWRVPGGVGRPHPRRRGASDGGRDRGRVSGGGPKVARSDAARLHPGRHRVTQQRLLVRRGSGGGGSAGDRGGGRAVGRGGLSAERCRRRRPDRGDDHGSTPRGGGSRHGSPCTPRPPAPRSSCRRSTSCWSRSLRRWRRAARVWGSTGPP
jgi:hypothetical protein